VVYGFNSQVGLVKDTSGNPIGTVNLPGGIKPTITSTSTSTNQITKDPINVYYSDNPKFLSSDPNSISIWTDKEGNIIGDNRPDIDIPIGLNLKGIYEYGGKKGVGYDILKTNLMDITKTATETTTTTNYGYNFLGLKTATFSTPGVMPSGQYGPAKPSTATVVYRPGDMFAVDQKGQIGLFKSGSTLPAGSIWIDEKGQRLYGDIGTAGQTKENIRIQTQAKINKEVGIKRVFSKGMNFISSGFTWSDPLKLTSAFQTVDYGIDAVRVGKKEAGTEFNKDLNRIYENTYTSIYSNTGQGYKGVVGWASTTPPVVTSAVFAGGYAFGAVASQAGLALTTVPSIATSTPVILGTAKVGAMAGTAISIGTPLIAYAVNTHIYNVNKTIRSQGGDWADVAGRISYEGVNMVAFSAGTNYGFRTGLPVQYRGVQIEGNTVSEGFYNAWTGSPIYTKSLTSIGQTGKLTYTNFGTRTTGQLINYNSLNLKGAYTPSGKIETSLYLQNIKTYGTPGINAQSAYGVTGFTYGTKANIYNKEYLRTELKNIGFKEKTVNALDTYFKKQKNYEAYGSSATSAQMPNYRTVHDIDAVFYKEVGATKATEIANIINLNEGRTVINRGGMIFFKDTTPAKVGEGTGQVLFKKVKVFDIHGTDTPAQFQAVNNPFGFNKLKAVNIGGVQSSQLSQEGVNKLASVGSLQPSGVIGPDMAKRSKDLADFYVIQKELIQVKGGSGSISTATQLTTGYYNSVVNNFGAGSFSNYPKLFGYSSPSITSTSTSAYISGPISLMASSRPRPSPKLFTSGVISNSGNISPSIFVSPSPSPSISRYPSISPSTSISKGVSISPRISASPYASPSISFSPSPSISLSLSPSISPSPSPSISPSISPSPSSFYAFIPPVILASGFNDLGSNILKGGKRKTAYIPSFSALAFKQTGTYKKGSLTKTGLDYRPITKSWTINSRAKLPSIAKKIRGFKF
jgi:hypothetical protein